VQGEGWGEGWFGAIVFASLFLVACAAPPFAGPQKDGGAITPQGWLVTPAGTQSDLASGPLAIAQSPDGKRLLVAHGGYQEPSLEVLDPAGHVLQRLTPAPGEKKGLFTDGPGPASGFYAGLAFSPDSKTVYASDGTGNALHVYRVEGQRLTEQAPIPLPPPRPDRETYPAGIAISTDGKTLLIVGNLADTLYRVDAGTGKIVATIPVGHLPYGVVFDRAGTHAYVTNGGARTVSVVDLARNDVTATIETGTHPAAIAANPVRDEIYVANADSDTVTVLSGTEIVRRIDLHPYPGAPIGASPNALGVSPDGGRLYVANGLDDDVAVVALDPKGDRIQGLIPTGWYPSGVLVDAGTLYVTNLKGLGAGPAKDDMWTGAIHGTLSRIPVPDAATLAAYTAQVRRNDRFDETPTSGGVIPRPGGPASPIKHVIYVLKENRTYDQVLGDLKPGNGDPSLTLFGEEVTPNHHALARQFVTLDNFYADAEVSVDGWSWSNGAYANTYIEKNWPLEYGNWNRPDDMGGYGSIETAALPGEKPGEGFIWDQLARAGIDYVNFGFFVNNPPVVDASMRGLVGHTDPLYPGWDLDTTDQTRMARWLKVFAGYEASGQMPRVQFMTLPSDHTTGTKEGKRTPRAYLADNDLALGKLVETVSHSKFWADTAIFVVEDDAQDGPDHVDGHRTVAFAISPYTQTGKVDSTFYSSVSMLRTIELLTGVPPMSQFDAAAHPMVTAFTDKPNLTPYTARPPRIPLDETNGPEAPLARQSGALDFSKADRIPMALMNEILWKSVKGKDSILPPSVHGPALAVRRAGDDD
jgi:YVTN family beta-propeller protein